MGIVEGIKRCWAVSIVRIYVWVVEFWFSWKTSGEHLAAPLVQSPSRCGGRIY